MAQALIQGLGFVSGLLVIRLLSPEQYAYYTIAYAGLGMLTLLCDAGIGSGVMAIGGRCWQEPDRLGTVFASGMKLRYRLAMVGVVISFPVLYLLIHRQGAFAGLSLLLCASIIPVFLATLTGHLQEIVVKLHQKLIFLQAVQLGSTLGRLLLLAAFLQFFPLSWVALIIAGIAQWGANLCYRYGSAKLITASSPADAAVDKELKEYLKKTLPGAFYYAFAGQISVWLISVFGSVEAVAKVGVAGRIGMICTVIISVFNILVVPRFARLPADGHRLFRFFALSLVTILVLGLALAVALTLFPSFASLLVGHAYGDMQSEIYWSIIATVLAMTGGAAYGMGAVRGFIMKPYYSIGIATAATAFLVCVSDLKTATGVLKMNAFYGLVVMVMFAFYVGRKTYELPASVTAAT